MYWPVGSPKIYALSRHAAAASVLESDDEAGAEKKIGDSSTPQNVVTGQSGHSQNGGSRSSPEIGAPHTHDEDILAAEASRGGSIFITLTTSRLVVWQSKPIVALASVVRSEESLRAYGQNVALLLRSDALIVTMRTSRGFLISYSLYTDPSARVYQTHILGSNRTQRRDSVEGTNRKTNATALDVGAGEGEGIREVNLRFRMVIRIDAGINAALALEDELVVATQKPPAIQCIRWVAEDARAQTKTEVLTRMPWLENKAVVTNMLHDRPMKLTVWICSDGRAYAVQSPGAANVTGMSSSTTSFRGFCFHRPELDDANARRVAVSPRFSLIAVGRSDGSIDAYIMKDYSGNIPLSHRYALPISPTLAGLLLVLKYSPDGYCLFAGYERGWAMWSVYGKSCATSFGTNSTFSKANDERWLHGVSDAFWIGGGCELAMICPNDNRIWVIDMARSATIGCHSTANISRSLLHTSESIVLSRSHDVPDLTALSSDVSLWQTVQIPSSYLINQWPIKAAVICPDGKYVAVAGRRGLAHYSVASGRWKTFDHPANEFEFSVRGGMCWYQHVLIACVEVGRKYQIRLYSREKALDFSHILHTETLPAPAICTTVSGTDSLLVYTFDNNLLHYIIAPNRNSFKLVQVGQIGFHGVIRAPPRVRAISWLLPEDQREHGEPSQDVATASVLFLVDGKLVLLQPSTNEQGELKYDMRVIVQNAEHFLLTREQSNPAVETKKVPTTPVTPMWGPTGQVVFGNSLRDALWYFDGTSFFLWPDVQDVLACAPSELGRELPLSIRIGLDFYPLSALIPKGVIHGLDAELIQRRDVNFSYFRYSARAQLFLPQMLRYHLSEYNSPAALHLARSYEHLPYLSHALELLLHQILDSEVDNPPSAPEVALLPTALSFLSSFPEYLDIIVNCTRKTELRSWRTLFGSLPPVISLFEQSLTQNKLKTAAGYLLVLHAFQSEVFQVHEVARLMQKACDAQDWDLCKELARFLVGIDASGETLRAAMAEAALGTQRPNGSISTRSISNGIDGPLGGVVSSIEPTREHRQSDISAQSGQRQGGGSDYFSEGHGST